MGVTTASRAGLHPNLGWVTVFTWDPTSLLEACQVTSQHFGPFPEGPMSTLICSFPLPTAKIPNGGSQGGRDLTSSPREEDNTIVLRTEVLWFFFWEQR